LGGGRPAAGCVRTVIKQLPVSVNAALQLDEKAAAAAAAAPGASAGGAAPEAPVADTGEQVRLASAEPSSAAAVLATPGEDGTQQPPIPADNGLARVIRSKGFSWREIDYRRQLRFRSTDAPLN
jgi:hypothetical protein